MVSKKASCFSVVLGCFVVATCASAEEWWKKNIDEYSYKKHTWGYGHTGEKIHAECSFVNDERHRILVSEDFTNKIKALGYKSEEAGYRVISVSNLKRVNPDDPLDLWFDGILLYGNNAQVDLCRIHTESLL